MLYKYILSIIYVNKINFKYWSMIPVNYGVEQSLQWDPPSCE